MIVVVIINANISSSSSSYVEIACGPAEGGWSDDVIDGCHPTVQHIAVNDCAIIIELRGIRRPLPRVEGPSLPQDSRSVSRCRHLIVVSS